MKQLVLTINEEETLRDLLNEEIEEIGNGNEDYTRVLSGISIKLEKNDLSEEIRLGIEVGKLAESYKFKDIYYAIIGKTDACYYIKDLFKIYNNYGYEKVNKAILEVGKEKYKDEVNENE